jgi:hypothetical protein
MSRSPRRYLPGEPFPPYAYVPGGADPHPVREPGGHSYGREAAPPAYLPAERWRENRAYLRGVDLYNHGYLWEAHEAWEELWQIAKGEDPLYAELLQGLIQCAAACLKARAGEPAGLAKLGAIGAGRLERVARARGPAYLGLDLEAFARDFRAFASASGASAEERPLLSLAAD